MALAALLAGAAPPGMTRPPPSLERTELLEAIDAALDTKEADIALPWLAEELSGWERDFACALLCLGCGQLDQGDRFNQLCAAAPASFASICDMIRDAAMLREGRAAEADTTRRAQKARELRNGLGLAEAALSAVEAAWNQEHHEQAETLRLSEGRWLYHHGGVPGVSLLARWSPLREDHWDD